MSREDFDLTATQFGFTWGPAEVMRIADDPQWGVMLEVRTPRQRLEIRVTPSGLIRVSKPLVSEKR